ncbi:MAG: NADH-quinone oxidoreductase subunit F [Nitrospiria bacterium]
MNRSRILTDRDLPLTLLSTIEPISHDTYLSRGGYSGLSKAIEDLGPSGVLDAVRRSGLRGRGGAGFPTWKKWDMVAKQRETQRYLCCNAAEDEPGTFKDRFLLRSNPHQLIEGAILSAYAIGAEDAYLYINCRFEDELQFMEDALQESKRHGYWGDLSSGSASRVSLKVCPSPGTYVAGEETALLEVIEGKVAEPRQKPPYYPSMHGLFGKPTVVNNAESISNIPSIVREGGENFRETGSKNNSGTMIFSLTGDVNQPGLYERPLGTPLRTLIETCGKGIKGGMKLKGVFPGGPSTQIVPADQIDVPLDFDSLKAIGSGLGTGAVIVMSETTCMLQTAIKYTRFFARESCGQCPPCQLGTVHLAEILEKIEAGDGSEKDIRQIDQVCRMIKGRGQCFLLTGAAIAVESIFHHFRSEFDQHLKAKACPFETDH